IAVFTQRLKEQDLWKEEDWARMEEEVAQEIAKAIEFAEAGTWEPVEDLTRFVYSEQRPHLFLPPQAGEDEGGGIRERKNFS
ncbi:MAG TPA: hypothetical protein VFU31_25780, partial [Candidatus Binatia bacterium]|nr:hypothetical protein [Candidatus Binatia bacterium]